MFKEKRSDRPAGLRTETMAQRLERGQIVDYPICPFPLPEGDDREFLFEQQLASLVHKNIAYNPATGKASGFHRQSAKQAERLRELLASWAQSTTAWASSVLPSYARSWQPDRVSYRPAEEATRKLRMTARNDLLHVDAFPTRPTGGARILRVFANINRTEPRVWLTSHPFAELLKRYGKQAGLPGLAGPNWTERLGQRIMQLFRPGRIPATEYDAFMNRLHDFLKANKDFQSEPARRWEFAPGSAWVVITDTASHAVLCGRYALEHSYFVAQDSLALPLESPAYLLEQTCAVDVLRRAA
jgi:hypothetical protein